MGASLIPLLFWDPATELSWLMPLLLFHAFAAATQDASIDALAVSCVPRSELGSVNGWMQVGVLLGRSALGGGALLLEEFIGSRGVILLLLAVIWSSSLLVLTSRESEPVATERGTFAGRLAMLGPKLRDVFSQKSTLLGLVFALVAGAGFEGVGALAGPFLIDRGLESGQVGRFFGLNAVLGMVAGSVAGGFLADVLGKRKTVSLSIVSLSVTILVLSAYDMLVSPPTVLLTLAMLTVLYLFIGLFTTSSYAMLMGITDARVGATQFSAFMAATNACESWAGFAAGRAVPSFGYGGAFGILALVPLTILPWMRHISSTQPSAGEAPAARRITG
jgi:hypothetical protein